MAFEEKFRLILIFSFSLNTGFFLSSLNKTGGFLGLQSRIIAGVKKSSLVPVLAFSSEQVYSSRSLNKHRMAA